MKKPLIPFKFFSLSFIYLLSHLNKNGNVFFFLNFHSFLLLHDYVDVFACSYQDMPLLDTDIMVHHLPLKEDCPPMKQKLRRTRLDMAMKIKEEVQK